MRRVFIDTLYLLATVYPRDTWHLAAERAGKALLETALLVTTHEVMIEFLSGTASMGAYYRGESLSLLREMHSNPNIGILPFSSERYWAAVRLYEKRPDKSYSLVDCISMVAMKEEGISEILTHDNHFTQEGFTLLIHQG